ncbi:hypothetical protein ACLBYG_22285 [Methylobacterium sp. D53M]
MRLAEIPHAAMALVGAVVLAAPAAPPSGSPPKPPLPAILVLPPEPEPRKRPAYRPLH